MSVWFTNYVDRRATPLQGSRDVASRRGRGRSQL